MHEEIGDGVVESLDVLPVLEGEKEGIQSQYGDVQGLVFLQELGFRADNLGAAFTTWAHSIRVFLFLGIAC